MWNSREEREKIVKQRTRVECGLNFSPHAEHVRNFSRWRVIAHRNWRPGKIISRLTNPRRACQPQIFFAWFFYCFLPSSRRPPACTRSFLPQDRTMHWNSRPLRWAIQDTSFSLCLSLFLPLSLFFLYMLLRKMPRWKGSRTERKSQSFRHRMPFKLFIRISRSWGRAMTGRSNECGVNRLQEAQKITSRHEVRGNLIVVAREPSVSLKDPRRFLV